MATRDPELTTKIVESYHERGSIQGVARELGIKRDTVRDHLKESGNYDKRPFFAGRVSSMETKTRPLPKTGRKVYFLTSAQNNTKVAPKAWETVLKMVDFYDAEILVGSFSYNKAAFGNKSTKRGRGPAAADEVAVWYDSEIEPYIVDDPVQLAPGLEWRGEMNILPTAVRPLSGLESYTGRRSGIFPHVKVSMESVVSGKLEPTKFNYTTGTVTKRNYIQKKEGLKAEFHHVYGGLIVEVTPEGDWFVRQFIIDDQGIAHDLTNRFSPDGVLENQAVEMITWGDIHLANLEGSMKNDCWGPGGMLDVLKPRYQVMHDLLDFRARNAHIIKKNLIHDRFANFIAGHDSVEDELKEVAEFLRSHVRRKGCKILVVDSNHDQFMFEWLRIGDYRFDPINAVYFLRAQLHVYEKLSEDPRAKINLFKWAVERINGKMADVEFLDQDEPKVILDIEHGMHGHLGGNGARGSSRNAAKMGRKVNRGHEHSASIVDGVYTSGISSSLDQGYNRGPSSWSQTHIITYANGKRSLVTMWNGKWRA